MKKIYLILIFLASSLSFSQTKSFEISGILNSEIDKTPLESATVYLQRVKDSTLITYTITDSKGKFTLESKTNDKKVTLFISYIGYQTYKKEITLNQQTIDLGSLDLKENANTLDAVTIKAKAPPIAFKKDTLEFNTKYFKTKKDANVEDLLKKLPGVEVTPDGKIKVNGKEVNKILVNGKPFFANDITIATRNLTKDIIEKIQVSDTKTDEEAFTGEDGEQTSKTINLVIKKENNKGSFGRLAAGAGTDDRYEYAGIFNRFDNDLRISVLAGGNNVNSPGFSYGEIDKMFGGSSYNTDSQIFNYGKTGLITSQNLGFNYVDDWGKKADISTNYFTSNSDSYNAEKSERENIVPGNRYFTNSNSITNNNTEKHSTENKLKIKLDSTLLITLTPVFKYTKSTNHYLGNGNSFDENRDSINTTNSNSFNKSINNQFSNNLNITKRFGTKGAFVRLDMYTSFAKNESEDRIDNTLEIYGDTPEITSTNQLRDGENNNNTFVLETAYRMPLKEKEISLDLSVGYRKNIQKNIRNSFDYNETSQDYENYINEDFSSDYQYDDIKISPGVNLRFQKKKWSTSFKAEYLLRTLKNTDYLRPQFDLERNFNAAVFNYRLNYRTAKSSLGIYYSLRNDAPYLSQLQKFVDVTNPSNTIVGNQNLTPRNTHYSYVYFRKNNFQKGIDFNAYINSNIQNNSVISKTKINDDLTRETTYVNVNGTYSLYGNVRLSKKVKIDTLKSISFNVDMSSSIRRSINFINEQKYASLSNSIYPSIGTQFTWSEVIELGVYYRPNFTINSFDTNVYNSQIFLSHNISFNTTNHIGKKLDFRNDINYSYNPNIADDFEKSAWFWNATLAYSLLKDKATLSLKAYDILNQNINARRIANQNYIEDRESTVLQQYFMLSFSWKFNSLGKKGEVR